MFPCSTPKIKEIPKELGFGCGAAPWESVHWRCGNLFLRLKNGLESSTCLWPLLCQYAEFQCSSGFSEAAIPGTLL